MPTYHYGDQEGTHVATNDVDIFVFKEGQGYHEEILEFDARHDSIDLSGFGERFTWEELKECMKVIEHPVWGGPAIEIDLTQWGGGYIRVRGDYARDGTIIDATGDLSRDNFVLPPQPNVVGTDGDDTLEGGAGDDIIVTGDGKDTVVFSPGDGHDTVEDFQNGQDKIDLSGFPDLTWRDVTAKQDGDNVVIEFRGRPNDSITLVDFELGDLNADDFIYSPDADADGM